MEAVIDLQVNTTEEKQGTKQSKEETKDDAKDTDIKVQDVEVKGDSLEKRLQENPKLQNKLDILMTEIKALFAIKHMKNDGLPMEIIPNLYLGSIGAAFSKKNLQDAGITHILCVADQIKSAYPDDFVYKKIAILDKADADIKQHFKDCGEFINDALNQKGKKVLVHCFAGKSRSTTVLAAYLMQYKNMKRDEALKLIKEKRPVICPNLGFMSQLKQFESHVATMIKTNELSPIKTVTVNLHTDSPSKPKEKKTAVATIRLKE